MFKSHFFLIVFAFLLLLFPTQVSALTIEKSASVGVDAFIGEHHFILYGYTSPRALVTFEGLGIYDQTFANNQGYFEFNNRFSPLSPREACLTSQDQLGRISSPVCLPPFPTKYDVNIGPVIMPPTISLNNPTAGGYYQGDEIQLSGQTIPDSEVSFSTFVDEKKSLFPTVYAFTFPQLTTKSDVKGNFSLALPSSSSQFFRLFAQTNYENNLSPESIMLNLKVLPIWMIIIQLFLWLFSLLKPRLLEIVILCEIACLVIFFLRRYLHPHVIAKNRALAIRQLYPILKEETEIIPAEKYPLAR